MPSNLDIQRRRKNDIDRRDHMIRVRVNQAENEHLKKLARQAGETPSSLIRNHIGQLQIRNRRDEQQRIAVLNRVNSNLNMIARWCNIHKGAAKTVAVISHLKAIQQAVEIIADQQKGKQP